MSLALWAYPSGAGFQGGEVPKPLLYYASASSRPDQTTRLPPRHPAAFHDLPRRTLLFLGCAEWLELLAIQRGCPPWYQIFQASPQIPAVLLRPHLPTTAVFVRPSRAGRPRDFHPFDIYRVGVVTHAPVSTSPNIVFSRYGPVGSQKGGQRAATCEGVEVGSLTPQRSSYAAPALLEACGSRQCPLASHDVRGPLSWG